MPFYLDNTKYILLGESVTNDNIADNAVTDAKVSSISASKLTGGLPAISGANLTGLPSSAPGAQSITQSMLKTATSTVVSTSHHDFIMPGGEYAFWASVRSNANSGASYKCAPLHGQNLNVSLGTTFRTRMQLSVGSSNYMEGRQRYVQASPPYDLGDGEVHTFIQALIEDGTGKISAMCHAPDPVWANNGPTCIRPEYERNGKFYRDCCTIDTSKDFQDPTRIQHTEQEITAAFKNSDMAEIPHPFLGNDMTGKSIILIDPNSDIARITLEMEEAGENPLEELFHKDYVRFDNEHLTGRKTPSAEVMVVKPTWKVTS